MHGIQVLMAKNYIDNLATRRIDPDPEQAPIIVKLFECRSR